MRVIVFNLANVLQNEEIGAMPANRIRFVLVNDIAPRKTSTCSGCSRTLKRGYLRDRSNLRWYCGIACYDRWTFGGFVIPTNLFELAIVWSTLTFDVATATFDGARNVNLSRYPKHTLPKPAVICKMVAPSIDPAASAPLDRIE
jgi:hypothetical protein